MHTQKRVAVLVAVVVAMWASTAAAQVRTRVLHSFTGPDGADPSSGLIETPDGSFLGTTYAGGELDLGTIYRMTPNGTVTVVHSFTGEEDGSHPSGTLLAAGGAYYGKAGGGTPNRGIIFRMTADGVVSLFHEFQGGADDGSGPGGLMVANDGQFYGTTVGGGEHDKGTVYRMSADGHVDVIYSFPGGLDGERPGGLIQASDGNFYGTAGGGYSSPLVSGLGIVYKMAPDGTVTVLHRFVGLDGNGPGGLVQALDGNLYGTTIAGGLSRIGTVFRMTLDGNLTVIHSFTGSPNGANPLGLTRGTDGALYGVTSAGGRAFTFSSTGMAYRITTGGAFTNLHVFQGAPFDAYAPNSGLLQGSDGNFYGSASAGGWEGDIFRIDTLLCEDSVDAAFFPSGLSLSFTLHSWAPGTWRVWAFTQAGVFNLWSKEIPALVPPAVRPGIGFQFPQIGPVGILTTLTTPSLNSMCLDWKVVDTGSPPTSSSR